MFILSIHWDLEDDPQGNVQHMLRLHHIKKDEAEEVLRNPASETTISKSTGVMITSRFYFGRPLHRRAVGTNHRRSADDLSAHGVRRASPGTVIHCEEEPAASSQVGQDPRRIGSNRSHSQEVRLEPPALDRLEATEDVAEPIKQADYWHLLETLTRLTTTPDRSGYEPGIHCVENSHGPDCDQSIRAWQVFRIRRLGRSGGMLTHSVNTGFL